MVHGRRVQFAPIFLVSDEASSDNSAAFCMAADGFTYEVFKQLIKGSLVDTLLPTSSASNFPRTTILFEATPHRLDDDPWQPKHGNKRDGWQSRWCWDTVAAWHMLAGLKICCFQFRRITALEHLQYESVTYRCLRLVEPRISMYHRGRRYEIARTNCKRIQSRLLMRVRTLLGNVK